MKPNLTTIGAFYGTQSLALQGVSLLSLLLLCGVGLTSARAATLTWTGAVSSDWNNRTNWSPQQVPTSADTAVINSGTVTSAPGAQFSALNFNGGNLSGPVLVAANSVMNWAGGRLAQGSSLTVQTNGAVNVNALPIYFPSP